MEMRKLWEDTKEILEREFSEEIFEMWISPLELDEGSEGDELILIAPMSLNKKEIKKYQSFIDNTIFYSFGVYKLITITFIGD